MKFNKMMASVTANARENGPKWATRAGFVGMGIGALWLAKKAGEEHILADARQDIKNLKEMDGEQTTEEDRKEDIARVRKNAAKDSLKAYWAPSAVLVGSFVVGNIGCTKLDQQKLAAEGALMTTLGLLTRYRRGVREEIGEDKEHDIYENAQNLPQIETNGGNSETKKLPGTMNSGCTFTWGPRNEDGTINNAFDPHSDLANFMTVKSLCTNFNRDLQNDGYVELTRVLNKLDLTPRSYLVNGGWTIDHDGSGKLYSPLGGDGYISFGLATKIDENGNKVVDINHYVDQYDLDHDSEPDHEATPITLEFNIDGDIRPYFAEREKRFLIPAKN